MEIQPGRDLTQGRPQAQIKRDVTACWVCPAKPSPRATRATACRPSSHFLQDRLKPTFSSTSRLLASKKKPVNHLECVWASAAAGHQLSNGSLNSGLWCVPSWHVQASFRAHLPGEPHAGHVPKQTGAAQGLEERGVEPGPLAHAVPGPRGQ